MKGITVTKSPEGIKDDNNIAGEDKQTKKKKEPMTCKFRFQTKSIKEGRWFFLRKLMSNLASLLSFPSNRYKQIQANLQT